jgi:hypothetical protein
MMNLSNQFERFAPALEKWEKSAGQTEQYLKESEEQIKENLLPEEINRADMALEQFKCLGPQEAEALRRVYSLLYADNIG